MLLPIIPLNLTDSYRRLKQMMRDINRMGYDGPEIRVCAGADTTTVKMSIRIPKSKSHLLEEHKTTGLFSPAVIELEGQWYMFECYEWNEELLFNAIALFTKCYRPD